MKPHTVNIWAAVIIAFIAISGVWLSACSKSSPGAGQAGAKKSTYYCPMHPTYTSDRPGECPICHMSLVSTADDRAEGGEEMVGGRQPGNQEQMSEKKILFYRHPMNPKVTSPVPAKDEMGMDYVPVYEEETPGVAVPGQASVKINPTQGQMIGVRSAPVEKQPLHVPIRASGRVAYDPELYNALAEFKEILKIRSEMAEGGASSGSDQTKALLNASLLRLKQMGLSEEQAEDLAQDPENLLTAEPGRSVWAYAEVYESEAGLVKPGQTMEITSSASPGRRFTGKIVAVDSVLNPQTRTLKARARIPNPEGLLKPGMFADAMVHVNLGRKLVVPVGAVLDTGTRKLVFVEKAPGQFDPREVRVGHEADDFVEVLSGLKAGERVVTSANFLIDSESKLKSALSSPTGEHAGH
ncbi:MAG: efflux RND transporter periplasmic adaptor subunit [Elusimicrobia bacterium]|nr:efflux RND transporter periplasmic adaptor subunit [Elusimicrobiota bacterium]